MPIVEKQAFLGNGGARGSILTTLRRAGIPVAGLGVAAAPKRVGLPVRLSGMGRTVQHNFFGVMETYPGVEDVMAYWSNSWQSARGSGNGFACQDIQRDPATASDQLQAVAVDHCGLAPEACSGIDVPGVAAQLAREYAAWFASTFPRGWGNCYAAGSPYGPAAPAVAAAPVSAGGGQPTAYSIPNTVTPTYGTVTPITGGGGPTAAAPSSASGTGTASSGPVQVSLRNTSRPNMPLAVGDRFELVIAGSPNSPVSIDATRNGSQRGVSAAGATDSQGFRVVAGVMSEAEVGSWSETISVGNSSASLSFQVAAAPTMTAGGPAASGSGGSTTGGGGATATTLPDLALNDRAPASTGLPSWVLPAAIAAAAVLMLRK